MSITLRTTIVMTARIVVSNEMLAELDAQRSQCRAMAEERPQEMAEMSANKRHLVDLMIGDMSAEELMKVMFRQGFRDYAKDEMSKELNGSGLKFDRLQTKVAFSDNSPKGRFCSCNACFECKIARGGYDE